MNNSGLIDSFLDTWVSVANSAKRLNQKLFYYRRNSPKPECNYLLISYDQVEYGADNEVPVMNTMRNIEETTNLEVKGDVRDVR